MLRKSNANDTAGAPLGFGDVMFSVKDEAPVVPLFSATPVVEQVAMAA